MPLYGSGYIFSKKFFTGWVTVGIIWISCSFVAVGLYPAWESRVTLVKVVKLIVTGKKPRPVLVGAQTLISENSSGSATPIKSESVSKVG